MTAAKIPATVDALLRAGRRLGRVERGMDLLRRKREALARRLLGLSKPLEENRERIERLAARGYDSLLAALSASSQELTESHGWPTRVVDVKLSVDTEWAVSVATVDGHTPLRRDPAQRAAPPASVGPEAVAAADRFEELVELLLDVASEEARAERLGQALARTSRQVETLDRRVAPHLRQAIRGVRRVLDEREREDKMRRRHLLRVRSLRREAGG